jgi:lysozyme
MRQINTAGLNLIESFEGCILHPYLDAVKLPTIGIGTTVYPDGKKVTMKDLSITKDQARAFLKSHMDKDCVAVSTLVKVVINDNQFAALVSFAYNLGTGALSTSTLLRKLNLGDVAGAADEFLKWTHAGGIELRGLVRRRQAERTLFLRPV